MGIAMSFILGLFLRIFQFFCFTLKFFNNPSKFIDNFSVFCPFFYFFTKKIAQTLMVCGFARPFFVCPRSITSGLLYRSGTNLDKKGGFHD